MSLFSHYIPLKKELEKYIAHCKSIFEQIGDHASSVLVEGFIKDLENQRYNITLVGSLKRGKSTLLNVLMEQRSDNISPISSSVCTSAIIKYLDKNLPINDDKQEKASIYFNGRNQSEIIPLKRLCEYVTEEGNPGNRKNVRSVDVFGDFPEWSRAVTVIDSPGQNSVYNYHDTLLTDFLPFTDAIIFLVAADIPLDGGDIALLKELSKEEQRKIFFVLTKVDSIVNQDDLPDVIDFVNKKITDIGIVCEKLYTVSAKPVFDALIKDLEENEINNLKSQYGILDLEKDLEKFIVTTSDQTEILKKRIKTIIEKTFNSCNIYIEKTEKLLNSKSFDLASIEIEQKSLNDANSILQKKTEIALINFDREWSKALKSFHRKFSSRSTIIEDKIFENLNRGGLIGTIFKSFKLQQKIKQVVCFELENLIIDLENQLEDIIKNLNKEFDEELTTYYKKNKSNYYDPISNISSLAAATGMIGTVAMGIHATHDAVNAALSAFSAWQTAVAGKTIAIASNSGAAIGWLPRIGRWLWGNESTIKVAEQVANAANSATSAITAGVSAVITAGTSIAITLIIQKLLHIGLVKIQEDRVLGITENIMKEVEDSLFNGLEKYKNCIIEDYKQNIENIIIDNNKRIEELRKLISDDNPEERKKLEENLEKVKNLLDEGTQVQSQMLLLN